MQITQEQFNQVLVWHIVCIPAADWPNPRATKDERTFYIAMAPDDIPDYVLRKVEFDKLFKYD